MQKYQIGTGKVNGQTKIIIYTREMNIDLLALLKNLDLLRKFDLNYETLPKSVKDIILDWDIWKITLPKILEYVYEMDLLSKHTIDQDEIEWLPPILYPDKLICLGANYNKHIAEMNSSPPKYPYTFLKPNTTLIGSGQTVQLPQLAKKVDWEAELAVIIGKKVRNISQEEVWDCIAGYSILHDVSARDWSKNKPAIGLDFVMSKGFDGFAPMGPYITPAEFVPDPQNLRIKLTKNGEVKQDAYTSDMLFGIAEIITHLSAIMTLVPGDVIATGSPHGVGHGMKPPEYIQSGDHIVIEIDHLGRLENSFI